MDYRRIDPLVKDNIYHIFTRSISKFVIFNNEDDYSRIIQLIDLCRFSDFNYKFSRFKELSILNQEQIIKSIREASPKYVKTIAYCIMPTHCHFILQQLTEDGISIFMKKILDSYSRYFNLKYHRHGPLWEGRFKNVLVLTDEQLMHLTRYLHLNPTSANLVKNPEDWIYSSYNEYIEPDILTSKKICQAGGLFDMSSQQYQKFTNDQKSYQKSISLIKNMLIDNYSG